MVCLVLAASSACTSGSTAGPAPSTTSVVTPRGPRPAPDLPSDDGEIPNPLVVPATGGLGIAQGGMRFDVSEYGYRESEYLFSGTAKTYPPLSLPTAPYRSRMVVWTPDDPDRYNGTTVVEWAQVSDFGQFELTVELTNEATMLIDRGYAFVLVSAEERGVCDRRVAEACTATSLRGADPARYGTLDHPGDPYSFDIFSQALQALKHPTDVAPLGDLPADVVIAEGFQESVDKWFVDGAPDPTPTVQRPFSSYGPLNEYIANGADAEARLVDAFLIDGAAPAITPTYRVPTVHHLDESAIRRDPTPDSDMHRTWEVVGAPHADRWAGSHTNIPSSQPKQKLTRSEQTARDAQADDYGLTFEPPPALCFPGPKTGNRFPRRFTLNAAVVALDDWARTGTPAPAGQPVVRVSTPPAAANEKLQRDADGNALGGIRSPVIDVPIAGYDGEGCIAAGEMTSFTPERLAELYPTHQSYVTRLLAATDEAVADGFLLCQDAETIMAKASASQIGGADPYTAVPTCSDGSQ